MKKYEKGKWYKVDGGHFEYFGKFLEAKRGCEFVTSEKIMSNKHREGRYAFNNGYDWKEISLSEIQQYLPDGYIDKITESCKLIKENLIEGKFYNFWYNDIIIGSLVKWKHYSMDVRCKNKPKKWNSNTLSNPNYCKQIKEATSNEIEWLKACEKANKFIPKEEITFNKPSTNNLKTKNNEGSIKVFKKSSKVSRGQRPTGRSIQIGRPARTTKGRHQGNVPNLQED